MEENKKSALVPILGYLYLILPILIFTIGWLKPIFAVTFSILILICSYFSFKNAPKIWTPKNKKKWLLVFFVLLISLIWVCSSGIGALVYQNLDHNCRNPIFELLVKQSWPVVSPDKSVMLTYYIGFWLPSAVVGKILNSIQIGYYFQILWATLGIFIVFYYILSYLKNKTFLPILIFIFFSGLDAIGNLLIQPHYLMSPISHLEWWFPYIQFSSHTTQLYWVFNQAIPAWVFTMLLIKEKNNKNIFFLYSTLLLSSTLPCIGAAPLVIYFAFCNGNYSSFKEKLSIKYLKETFMSVLSVQNILGTIIITLISYLFLTTNATSGTKEIFSPSIFNIILFVIFFYTLEVGIFILPIFKFNKKNPLLYIVALMLLVYPYIRIGSKFDFCMRGTIPALIILYLFIVKTLENPEFKKNFMNFMLLLILLSIGAITPVHEMLRTLYYTSYGITKQAPDLRGPNFFSFVKENRFLKTIGKDLK